MMVLDWAATVFVTVGAIVTCVGVLWTAAVSLQIFRALLR